MCGFNFGIYSHIYCWFPCNTKDLFRTIVVVLAIVPIANHNCRCNIATVIIVLEVILIIHSKNKLVVLTTECMVTLVAAKLKRQWLCSAPIVC